MSDFIVFFEDLSIADVPRVGGKNAALGEMVRNLAIQGVPVPGGFAVTAAAYRAFLADAGLETFVAEELAGLDPQRVDELARRGRRVRERLLAAELPAALAGAIVDAYRQLSRRYEEDAADVAVRSSATAEDLPGASFAGQQETYLNVRGEAMLLDACRRCFASLFTDRAIAYRIAQGFDHAQVALSVGVQKMVRSDLATSGVLFTLDTESGFRDVVLINAAYGLGENVVRGSVNPDEYCVFKPTLATGHSPILHKRLGSKEVKLVYDNRGGLAGTRNVPVSARDRQRFALSDAEILQLARWGAQLEAHFSAVAGEDRPMDVEWAKDGKTGRLFILQARPETVQARRDPSVLEIHRLRRADLAGVRPVLSGTAIGSRIGRGAVRVVADRSQMAELVEGEVLVTEMTDPDWVPVMKKAAAIVTERGGRTCHAAIVSRELGVPAVVGAAGALSLLAPQQKVTVSCAEGSTGHVYPGLLEVETETLRLADLPATRTKLMLNVADPDTVFELSFLPNDGVGLARMELIVSQHIGIHPMALLAWPDLEDAEAVERIAELTRGYADKADYFVERLAQGVAKIAAAFYPKPVILRMSDFKSNEYAGLVGGRQFEPVEENPMIGLRGASRYDHPLYREGFALECAAVARARKQMGLFNLKVMIPFCRTVAEGRRVLALMARHGLERGQDGLEVYVMCEIPANVVLARAFAEIFDGFSIGSNDLTQLVLGVDRDSGLLADLFDENNDAVLEMIRRAIHEAQAAGRKIGLCGQAPSDDPAFAERLVAWGIDSISVTPDALLRTRRHVAAAQGRQVLEKA